MTNQQVIQTKDYNELQNFDKGRDIKPEEDSFKYNCPNCQSENIDLIPLSIPWKTEADNSKLPPKLQKGYDTLLNRVEAILEAAKDRNHVFFDCDNCHKRDFIPNYIDRLQLIKWLQFKYKVIIPKDS